MSKPLILAAAIVLLSILSVAAQQSSPTPKPTVPPGSTELVPALILEITSNPTLPPSFLDVRGLNEVPTWIWMSKFMTLPGWQKPPGEMPIQTVRVEPQFNGQTVDVRISVLRGKTSMSEQEDLVGKYRLRIGEPKTIKELESFGIQPFQLVVKRSNFPLPPVPTIELRVSAVEVVRVDREAVPIPAYWVAFRNTTTKSILALAVTTINGPSALLQGREGRALIEPGAISEQYVSISKPVRDGNGFKPSTDGSVTLLIGSVVFGDGSFEGDKATACNFELAQRGRQLFLSQAISLLDGAGDMSPVELKAKLINLDLTRGGWNI